MFQMRNVALALLLANLLMLAWQRWVVPPEPSPGTLALPQDYSELVYMPRPGTAVSGDDPILGATPLTPDSTVRCLRIGPFGRESDAQRVSIGLENQGAEVSRSSEQGNIWVGHWVTVQNLDSREKAKQALATLAANSMLDDHLKVQGPNFETSAMFEVPLTPDPLIVDEHAVLAPKVALASGS